jgi:GNAT superfamily N-acetyltransferase
MMKLQCTKFIGEKATDQDILQMFPQCNKLFVNNWKQKIPSDQHQNETVLFLMYVSNKLIGFVIMRESPCDPYHPENYVDNDCSLFKTIICPEHNSEIPFFDESYMIHYRYILPEYRNKGFGTRIIKHIMKTYNFLIVPTNDAAIKSVEKSGCVSYGYLRGKNTDKVFRSK